MIIAGKLNKTIILSKLRLDGPTMQRGVPLTAEHVDTSMFPTDRYGNRLGDAWYGYAHVRAECVETRASDFLRAAGEGEQRLTVFRLRWRPDVSTNDRVTLDDTEFDIVEIIEIGRRRGLELRCRARS